MKNRMETSELEAKQKALHEKMYRRSEERKHPIKRLAILAGRYYFCIVIQKTRL